MHHYFITGTSRGIGEALARALLAPENQLFCVSRSDHAGLRAQAKLQNCRLYYQKADLSDPKAAQAVVDQWIEQIDLSAAESVCMVHNAGTLEPIGRVGGASAPATWQRAHQLNYLSPVLMTHQLLGSLQSWAGRKQVLMISSGAARSPRAGWAAYCSTKAGLEMFAGCLAAEQADQAHPVQVVSLAPGVVDTAMQDLIRGQRKEDFPSVDRFIQLKEEKQLWSPEVVAEKILSLLASESFGKEVALDLRLL
jgi:benzil reductase ((S)-benzoin forming)